MVEATAAVSNSWIAMIVPSLIMGIITFVVGAIAYKAKATAETTAIERELLLIQKDIARMETTKVDNEKFTMLTTEIRRLDTAKAEKEVVTMLIQQIQGIDNKLMQVLSILSEQKK